MDDENPRHPGPDGAARASDASVARPDTPTLRTEGLGRRVGGTVLVTGVSIAVPRGDVLAIVGPSGSGKSSFLRLLVRLDEPTEGTVYLDGVEYRSLAPRDLRRRVGYVAQQPALFPGSVADNVAYGPRQRGERLSDGRVDELLAAVGLEGFRARSVATLSGGEAQRVNLARTLANHPEVLLLDEPTSALDAGAREGVERLIQGIIADRSLTCLIVTHDQAQARRLADRVMVMRGGRMIETGRTEEVLDAGPSIQ